MTWYGGLSIVDSNVDLNVAKATEGAGTTARAARMDFFIYCKAVSKYPTVSPSIWDF